MYFINMASNNIKKSNYGVAWKIKLFKIVVTQAAITNIIRFIMFLRDQNNNKYLICRYILVSLEKSPGEPWG